MRSGSTRETSCSCPIVGSPSSLTFSNALALLPAWAFSPPSSRNEAPSISCFVGTETYVSRCFPPQAEPVLKDLPVEIKQPNRSGLDSASPEPQKPGILSKINIWRSLKSHAFIATAVALATLGLGAAVLSRHTAYYEATSVIYVSPTFPATLTTDNEQDRPYDSYIEEQAHTITRYDVMAEALHRLKPGMWQVPGESEESAVERLQKSLTAKRDGVTYQVEITLGGYQPQNLAEVVNTVTDTFLDKTKSEEFYGRDDRSGGFAAGPRRGAKGTRRSNCASKLS